MQIRDLIPWGRGRQEVTPPAVQNDSALVDFRRDINRVFDDFWMRFDRPLAFPNGFAAIGLPRTEISETENEVTIAVELPGLEPKDVEVTVTDDVLSIRGERGAEKEENRRGIYVSERSYGTFQRMLPVPPGVDAGKTEASFKNGVLTVVLPKTPEAKAKVKRIEVKDQ